MELEQTIDNLKFDYQVVDIDKLVPNTWNPKSDDPENYAQVLKSLKVNGLRLPITVREKGEGFEIIDGFHRWKACKELGYKQVVINNLGVVEDEEAKRLTITFQKVQVPFNEIMYASLLKELNKELGTEKMLETLPLNEVILKGYLEMANFDPTKNYKETDLPPSSTQGMKGMIVSFTEEQTKIVKQAIQQVRDGEDNQAITDSRGLELICADYIAGK
jgi:ParB family chromosome partitioning protein